MTDKRDFKAALEAFRVWTTLTAEGGRAKTINGVPIETFETALRIADRLQGKSEGMDHVLSIYQKEEDYVIKTFMDVKNLDPYKTLFIWKAFNEYFIEYMLRACGCDNDEQKKFEYAVNMLSKNVMAAQMIKEESE